MEKPLALSTAYATWVYNQDDGQWVIRDQDANELCKFPNTWDEKDCMIAIHFGRKYELEAFNSGIKLGKQEILNTVGPVLDNLRNQVAALEQMNIRLSNKLENFIIGEEDGTN